MNFIKFKPLARFAFQKSGALLANFEVNGPRCFMSSLSQQFEEAKAKLNTLSEEPGNDVKLKIYALFKQSTQGPVQSKRPGMTDFVGRAKWDAWKGIEDLSKEKAQETYIQLIESLAKEHGTIESTPEAASTTGQKFEYLLYEVNKGVCKITLNRPAKKNALSLELYEEWVSALSEAAKDPQVVVAVVTGAGDYFSSGNDLGNFMRVDLSQLHKFAAQAHDVLIKFVSAFIDFPKPLIGVVNGPAVGVSVTTLGLYDAVYATDRATFHTPFSQLGQSPEGCSSYMFPMLMGFGKASEMLLFNRKITAQEACERGLVTRVFPEATFQKEVWPLIDEYASFTPKSMNYSKVLIRSLHKDNLHKINKMECERLVERWTSDDCKKAIMAFFSKGK